MFGHFSLGLLKLITALRCSFICSKERKAASAVLESRLLSSETSWKAILYKPNTRHRVV